MTSTLWVHSLPSGNTNPFTLTFEQLFSALHLLSTGELIPSSICSFVCWIFSGSGRGRVSLLAGWSTLLASLYSLVGRWSKEFLQLWSLIVQPFPLPWSNYTLSLNQKETSFKHTSQVWPDCQSLTGFLMLPCLQMWLQLFSAGQHWAICSECWLASIKCSSNKCSSKQVLSFNTIIYCLKSTTLGSFGQSEK